MRLTWKVAAFIAAVIIILPSLGMGIYLGYQSFVNGDGTGPQAARIPDTPMPAPTAVPLNTRTPTPTPETEGFVIRDATSDSGRRFSVRPLTPIPPGGPSTLTPGANGDWTPPPPLPGFQLVRGTPFSLPEPSPASAPTTRETPYAPPALSPEPTPTPENSPDVLAPSPEPIPDVPSSATTTPLSPSTITPLTPVLVDSPHAEPLEYYTDAVLTAQRAFMAEARRGYRARMTYRFRSGEDVMEMPVAIESRSVLPHGYYLSWSVDPDGVSPFESGRLTYVETGGERFILESEMEGGPADFEARLCELLLCAAIPPSFVGAMPLAERVGGNIQGVRVTQGRFGGFLSFLSGWNAEVVYRIDANFARPVRIEVSGEVSLAGDGPPFGEDERHMIGFQMVMDMIYDDAVGNIDLSALGGPGQTPTQTPVSLTTVVVPTPMPTMAPTGTPAPIPTATPTPIPEPPPAPPEFGVVPIGDQTDEDEWIDLRALSYGYEVRLPSDWFRFDARGFGDMLGRQIENGVRSAFSGRPYPHLVAMDGFDGIPYLIFIQHRPPTDSDSMDAFMHMTFTEHSRDRLSVRSGWSSSSVRNAQGYVGRLYRYETNRDTVEWMVFFPREYDVLQALMEADVHDGEEIDYDALFGEIIEKTRLGQALGDDGSRPNSVLAGGNQGGGVAPSVTGVWFDRNVIGIEFSEPVWVSAGEASAVFARVRGGGRAVCLHPCDGSNRSLEFLRQGLSDDDVVDGFVYEDGASIRDSDGNRVPAEFQPYTRAAHPVVVRTEAALANPGRMAGGERFLIEFSQPVWLRGGTASLALSGGKKVPCVACPGDPESASRTLGFGWTETWRVPANAPTAGDLVLGLELAGDLVDISGERIASVTFERFHVVEK